MDQLQAPPTLPHIVQVYQPSVSIHPSLTSQGKVTYQQTITSESLHIPVTHELQNQQMLTQNQTVMSCQQFLQNVQPLQQMQSQVLQSADLAQPLQITSHVILPQVPVFKQHVLSNVPQQYYGQYEYIKDQHCVIAKVEPGIQVLNEKKYECKAEIQIEEIVELPKKKRCRNKLPNPNAWACNVRKIHHQRGEAYVSRRGKYVPERKVKTTKDCLKSCKYKCNEKVTDIDRQHLFKAFYSLNSNEKKHFLLNTTERHHVRHNRGSPEDHRRKYSFKYYFVIRTSKHSVCKNFYLGTLAISQKPVYNVHSGKSEVNLPKPDGRGLSESSTHAIPSEVKDGIRKHIMSFSTVDSKPVKQFSRKQQYLQSNLSIKQMFTMYQSDCAKNNVVPAKESMYRKIFKLEFNLYFKKEKTSQVLCCRCKGLVK